MNETTLNLIQAMANGDALETEQAFGAVMAEKLAVKLDDMRTGVAQNMFNQEHINEVHEKTVALAKEIAKKHKNMTSDVNRGNVNIYNKHDEEAADRLILSHTGKDKEGNDRFHLHRVHSSGEDSSYRNLTAAEVHKHAAKHIGNYNEE
jgi:hypothetical protein